LWRRAICRIKLVERPALVAGDSPSTRLDELTLAIVPVVLGGGRRLFRDVGKLTRLQLTDCRCFDSGIVLLRYQRTD
jgi:hypothetical protein